ncbi:MULTISPECIES: hypothetical protein [Paraburkholderia]|uniref:hypothetical protein n=1 Tax=Paraburkholderia TaxID=1822464 RepID=UPI00225C10F0|nr:MULTISPECIES: hypothetical protein [Paraburkholderia]MCX4175137.1 hypothetical protein [Paraburkholderia madseniana]MDQ6463137.1 hypothetical protein [Paraburkholderia madseniana]
MYIGNVGETLREFSVEKNMRVERAVNTPWEIVGDESFVPRQPARGPPVRGVEMLYDVLVFQRRRLFRWRVLRDFSRYSAAPTRITQAKSPAAAVAQDQAASARHVAIWRIFIVLFFPDFYC